jgi:aconitate hydratase
MDVAPSADPFEARATLRAGDRDLTLYRLDRAGMAGLDRAPVTVKILLENVLRHAGGGIVTEADVRALAAWHPGGAGEAEVPFMPARVILQDFTGVPAVVDLAAMRDAMAALGGDPARINPLVPADLVIDHSVQVDRYGTSEAFAFNVAREYERNNERYQLLRWAQTAFADLRVVPPGTGIVHQVNLEFLARVVQVRETPAGPVAFPDTLVGTDSHTTMISGLGVLGYGVGGIEAEAVLLGQPLYQPMPRGRPAPGRDATWQYRDRSRAGHQPDAAAARRGGRVRRVRGRRARLAGAPRPRDHRQHVPGIRGHDGPLPHRRGDAVVPHAHGP